MVAVIGVIGAIAVPRYSGAVNSHRASAAARRIVADLEYARTTAVSMSASQSVVFEPAINRYRLPGVAAFDAVAAEYGVHLDTAPYRVDLVSADFGSGQIVSFDGYGQPDLGGTVIVEAGGFRLTVDLDGDSGRATIR